MIGDRAMARTLTAEQTSKRLPRKKRVKSTRSQTEISRWLGRRLRAARKTAVLSEAR